MKVKMSENENESENEGKNEKFDLQIGNLSKFLNKEKINAACVISYFSFLK